MRATARDVVCVGCIGRMVVVQKNPDLVGRPDPVREGWASKAYVATTAAAHGLEPHCRRVPLADAFEHAIGVANFDEEAARLAVAAEEAKNAREL